MYDADLESDGRKLTPPRLLETLFPALLASYPQATLDGLWLLTV